jgi:hypothetical protein
VPDDLADALAGTYQLGQLQDALEQSGASEEQVAGLLSPRRSPSGCSTTARWLPS